jgi:hypothetical protein
MGIEDIQFLKSNASKEEYIAVIDSARREKTQYPTPQEYVVEFDAPFENVYGLDVIDVNIPRSGYVIDTYNNKLYFRFDYFGSVSQFFYPGEIPPGNYGTTSSVNQEIIDISDLIEAVENVLRDPSDDLNDPSKPGYDPENPNARRIRVEIVGAEEETNTEAIARAFRKNKRIRFKSSYVFAIDVKRSTFRTTIGLSDKSDVINLESTNDLSGTPVSSPVFRGPLESSETFPVTRDKYLIQTFKPSLGGTTVVRSGPMDRLTIQFAHIGTPPSGSQGFVTIRIEEELNISVNTTTFLVVYQKNIPYASLLQSPTVDLEGNDVKYVGNAVTIKKDVRYWMYIYDENNTDVNNCWAIRHGQLSNQPNQNTMYKLELGERIPYYDPFHTMDVIVYSLTTGQIIEPSGIIDLFGERYIQLRCPEIEEHLHRNRAYERYNVGLAIIPTSLEYRNLSEKFVMLPSRTFHPIGRLKRMTFRFETASGDLYNFNGIDHTITMVIRYYKVSEPAPMDAFLQNPRYRPNYLDYLHEHSMRDRSDSEDESEGQEYHPWP